MVLRFGATLLVLTVLFVFSSSAFSAATPHADEYELKAAYIYNFLKFVEWPESAFKTRQSPLVVGVVGNSRVQAAIAAAVQDRKIGGRDLTVQIVNASGAAKECQLLVVCGELERNVALVSAVSDLPTLTVGESEPFSRHGGIITFVLDGDKIRFDINMDAADRAGIKISAQLQKLAKKVRRNR